MSAFEKAWLSLCLPGEYDGMDSCDQGRWKGVAQQAWNAALEHAARIVEQNAEACTDTVVRVILQSNADAIREHK